MKVSEAIRAGRALVPDRCYETYFRYSPEGQLSVCEIGAAKIGFEGAIFDLNAPFTFGEHPEISEAVQFPIETFNYRTEKMWNADNTVFSAVAELQDNYHWTTDQIVGWLESIGK